jgi:hypothetical protein
MHPIERLRYVARASGDGSSLLLGEAAGALASFSHDPAALVTACRRLVDRQPHAAAMWWLAARVLVSPEPDSEAWIAADLVESDPAPSLVRDLVPEDSTVVVLGWPERIASGLARRGDVRILIVDALGDGSSLARRLERSGSDVDLVEERAVAAAVRSASLVMIEPYGLGPSGAVCVTGSDAAASVAHHHGVPVWAVAGVGTALPDPLWGAYLSALSLGPADERALDADLEVVPATVIDAVVCAGALTDHGSSYDQTSVGATFSISDAIAAARCPVAPELLVRL